MFFCFRYTCEVTEEAKKKWKQRFWLIYYSREKTNVQNNKSEEIETPAEKFSKFFSLLFRDSTLFMSIHSDRPKDK